MRLTIPIVSQGAYHALQQWSKVLCCCQKIQQSFFFFCADHCLIVLYNKPWLSQRTKNRKFCLIMSCMLIFTCIDFCGSTSQVNAYKFKLYKYVEYTCFTDVFLESSLIVVYWYVLANSYNGYWIPLIAFKSMESA